MIKQRLHYSPVIYSIGFGSIILSEYNESEAAMILTAKLQRDGGRVARKSAHCVEEEDPILLPGWLDAYKVELLKDREAVTPRLVFETLTKKELMCISLFNILDGADLRKNYSNV